MPDIVDNPPWVTKALAGAYETLEGRVPPMWLPKLDKVHPDRKNRLVAQMKEYGCGVYGCVLPTLDSATVLKLTTDDSEAQFAAQLSPTLVSPIVVEYRMVMELATKHEGRTIYLLWRESANHVDKLGKVLGKRALELVDRQHAAAQAAFLLIHQKAPSAKIGAALKRWLTTCDEMASDPDVPELRALGTGLAAVYLQQRIFISDVHAGNLGEVKRQGKKSWVITDPGNVVVF